MNLIELNSDSLVYFLHIPKTAGSSFRAILDNNFDIENIVPAYYLNDIKNIDKNKFNTYNLLRGHYLYQPIFDYFPKRPDINLTILRDPIKRTISHYNHHKHNPDNDLYLKSSVMTPLDFVRDTEAINEFYNLQTRYLAWDVKESLINYSDDEMLDIALKNLINYEYVGIVEYFEESMHLLTYILGWRPQRDIVKVNISNKRAKKEQINFEMIEEIKKSNQLDIVVYDKAKKIFFENFRKLLQSLDIEYAPWDDNCKNLGDYYDKNILYNRLEETYKERLLKRNLKVIKKLENQQALYNSGFYNREPGNFRLLGPSNNSIFDLIVDNTCNNNHIAIELKQVLSNELLDSMNIYINNKKSNWNLYNDKDNITWIILNALSKEDIKDSICTVSIVFNQKVSPPKSLDPTHHDTRPSSIGISSINIIDNNFISKLQPIKNIQEALKVVFISDKRYSKNTLGDFLSYETITKDIGKSGRFEKVIPLDGNYFKCTGWARDKNNNKPSKLIALYSDNTPIAIAPVQYIRKDVANFFNDNLHNKYGWSCTFNINDIEPGEHIISCYSIDTEHKKRYKLDKEHLISFFPYKTSKYSQSILENFYLIEKENELNIILESKKIPIGNTVLIHNNKIVKKVHFKSKVLSKKEVTITLDKRNLIAGKNNFQLANYNKDNLSVEITDTIDYFYPYYNKVVETPYKLLGRIDNINLKNEVCYIHGWAIDPLDADSVDYILIFSEITTMINANQQIQKKLLGITSTNQLREDVWTVLANRKLIKSNHSTNLGWEFEIKTDQLFKGSNKISAYIYKAETESIYKLYVTKNIYI